MPKTLVDLEDHEGIRNILNNNPKPYSINPAFESLESDVYKYVERVLRQNGTPNATGTINATRGIDLINIRNLAKEYDIAVPIARGGLLQGAMAQMWGMPVNELDIAAHNRKTARGKWIHTPAAEDVVDKKILLFDKDAVTGASIQKAAKMLASFKPSHIGVYFTYPITSQKTPGGSHIEGLPQDVQAHAPNKDVSLSEAGDAYLEVHEKTGTQYGRRRLAERSLEQIAGNLHDHYPVLSEAVKTFTSKQLQAYDSLNPFLEGITDVREKILARMATLSKNLEDATQHNLLEFPGYVENFIGLLKSTPDFPRDLEEELVRARYREKATKAAQNRNIENPHNPAFPLAAFAAARRAAAENYEFALIVGPEGFAYEPYFQDLGISTVAVNIPESGPNETRTITVLDDMRALEAKKVLIVEDDIRTGATLLKLLESIKPHAPKELGLYLGQPESFQIQANIPPDFKNTYLASSAIDDKADAESFRDHLKSKGLRIFKNAV